MMLLLQFVSFPMERLKGYYCSALLKRRWWQILLAEHLQQSPTSVSFLTCHAPFAATLHKTSPSSQLGIQTHVLEEAAHGTASSWSKHQLSAQAARASGRGTGDSWEAEASAPSSSFSTAAPRGDGLTPLAQGRRRPHGEAARRPQAACWCHPLTPRPFTARSSGSPATGGRGDRPPAGPGPATERGLLGSLAMLASHWCECGGLLPARGSHLSQRGWLAAGQ